MTRQYIKHNPNPKQRGPKRGEKEKGSHVCCRCKSPLPVDAAYHRKHGGIVWICAPCAADKAYRAKWGKMAKEDIQREINRLKERIEILSSLQ